MYIKEIKTILMKILLLMIAGSCISATPPEKFISAGAARVKLTPQVPIPMRGFANRTEPFKGVHDDIYARAIAFSDGDNKALIIAADIIGISNDLYSNAADIIEKETGIAGGNIMLCATHTHSGPVSGIYSEDASPEIRNYTGKLEELLVTVAVEAVNNLEPAFIGTGKGVCKMNINRRGTNTKGTMWIRRNPYGTVDNQVAVTKIDDAANNPLALLINWPCHATSMGSKNYLISGDWPGAAARYVEKNCEGEVIAPVTIGASGDINPIYAVNDFNTEIGEPEIIGIILGEESLSVSKDLAMSAAGTVKGSQRLLNLPGKISGEKFKLNTDYKPSGEDVPVRITVLKVGYVVFAGISGEVLQDIGLDIKKYSPYKQTIVITHCNGSAGYIPSDEAYEEGGYEVWTSRLMPGAGSIIIENVLDMINRL